MLHYAVGVGAVVHILHALEQAAKVALAVAQLLLDLVLVRHVHAADQQGCNAVERDADGRDQHHAQMALGGANAELGRFVGMADLLWRAGLADAVAGAQLVQRVHKIGKPSTLQVFLRVRLQQRHSGRIGAADHALLGDQRGHRQGLHQFCIARHGPGIL